MSPAGPIPLIGCRGFPVARERYFREFSAVEVSDTRARLPRLETARRWREEAPPGFDFSLVAPSAITHPAEGSPRAGQACGHFRDAPPVRRAWEAFEAVAAAVAPRFVVFETPPSFYPSAGHLKDMYAFFRAARRGSAAFVWAQYGAGWEPRVVEKVCADLKLILASDPINGRLPSGRTKYIRAAGRAAGGRLDRSIAFSDTELRTLRHAAVPGPAWVFFANAERWRDARRLAKLCAA